MGRGFGHGKVSEIFAENQNPDVVDCAWAWMNP